MKVRGSYHLDTGKLVNTIVFSDLTISHFSIRNPSTCNTNYLGYNHKSTVAKAESGKNSFELQSSAFAV